MAFRQIDPSFRARPAFIHPTCVFRFNFEMSNRKRLEIFFFWIVFCSAGFCHCQTIRLEANVVNLRKHVKSLVDLPGFRNSENPAGLNAAADYIAEEFRTIGLDPEDQFYEAYGKRYRNIIVRIGIGKGKKVVIGAHYDVCGDQPGADDNASAVAGLIEIGRALKMNEAALPREIELVAFTLEEPPFFGSEQMGSYVHAKSLHDKGEKIELMVSLEMIGYFSDQRNSQQYPLPLMGLFYPKTGNFIAGAGNFGSRRHLKRFRRAMGRAGTLGCEILGAGMGAGRGPIGPPQLLGIRI